MFTSKSTVALQNVAGGGGGHGDNEAVIMS